MSNLDNLINKITNDNKLKADDIVKEANEKAEKIIETNTKLANEQAKTIIDNAKTEATLLKERILAGKKLEIRDSLLVAKQQIIEETFQAAIEKLKNISAQEYEKFITSYLCEMSIVGDEEIIVPQKFKDIDFAKINATLAQKGKKGELKLSASPKEIDGGFLLIRGGVENNNTYESLLDYYREDLELSVAQNLF